MIKKNFGLIVLTAVIILLPIIAGLIMWNDLPEQIPTHWNAVGEVDGWSGKTFAVFGLPLFILLTVLIVATEITGDELKSALIALLVLVPYYISLFLFRNKIKRVFSFSIIE